MLPLKTSREGKLFSNRLRLTKIIFSQILLALMGWYAVLHFSEQCYFVEDALRLPDLCNNHVVLAGQCGIEKVAPGGIWVDLPQGDVFVPYQGQDAKAGGYADVLMRFSKETGFCPLAAHIHFDRAIKLSVSAAAALIVFLYFLHAYWRPRCRQCRT